MDQFNVEHDTQPLSNLSIYGLQPSSRTRPMEISAISQAFPTGTSLNVDVARTLAEQPTVQRFFESDVSIATFAWTFSSSLLAGFGLGPNLRYLRIAKNDKRISDEVVQAAGGYNDDADCRHVLGPGGRL